MFYSAVKFNPNVFPLLIAEHKSICDCRPSAGGSCWVEGRWPPWPTLGWGRRRLQHPQCQFRLFFSAVWTILSQFALRGQWTTFVFEWWRWRIWGMWRPIPADTLFAQTTSPSQLPPSVTLRSPLTHPLPPPDHPQQCPLVACTTATTQA